MRPGTPTQSAGASKTGPAREDTEFLDPVEIALAHAELTALLPAGWRTTLPSKPHDVPNERWRPDYSNFLERVVQLHAGCISWLDQWMGKLSQRGGFRDMQQLALLFELLERLLHAGAHPWHQRHLIELASWEATLAHELGVFATSCRGAASPGRTLMSAAECQSWIAVRRRCPQSVFANANRLSGAQAGFAALNPRGVLSSLGYEVGLTARKGGVRASHRHDTLKDALCIDLSGLKNRNAAGWWGPAGSEARAEAITRCLELFIRLAGARTSGDWSQAIEDWASDADWLRRAAFKHSGAVP